MARRRRDARLAHDPVAGANASKELNDVPFSQTTDWQDTLPAVDAVLIATKWKEYKGLKSHAKALAGKVIADPRRLLQRSDFPESTYLTIGWREA